jgi:diguanylate cyclase (GGDEF)-like protein
MAPPAEAVLTRRRLHLPRGLTGVSLNHFLLVVLGVAIIANVLLLVLIPVRLRSQRRALGSTGDPVERPGRIAAAQAGHPAGSANDRSVDPARGDLPAEGDAGVVAAIEAFVAEVSADPEGRVSPPSAAEVLARREAIAAAAPLRAALGVVRSQPRDREGERPAETSIPVPSEPVQAPGWSVAGLGDPASWERTVREESARAARFHRPVTVVMAELPRLDEVADRLGRDAADRVVAETARLLVAEGRAVDRIAWLDYARFGVLLMETEEARATDYVDRVRSAADAWLQGAGLSVRLSLGWASPAEGDDVVAAVAAAEARMRRSDGRGVRDAASRSEGT